MSEMPTRFRSPHLLDRARSALLLVDIQEKLFPAIEGGPDVAARAKLLVDAANVLGVPVLISEQYPGGLGKTIDVFAGTSASVVAEKKMFSCRECETLFQFLEQQQIGTVLLCGIEAHVCVAQTAFDLLASGYSVHVAADAVGSRRASDREVALTRMQMHGIAVTTAEAAVFEWCESADASEFKQISALVR